MNIFLITPIFATTTNNTGVTPVIHYFAKEWVKQGHLVHVFVLNARYPFLYYWISRTFYHKLNTRLGMSIPKDCPHVEDYIADGVIVHRRLLRKIIPHSKYKSSEITKAVKTISLGCEKYGIPDIFIGHWHNPQLEVLCELKMRYNVRIALVLHENKFAMEKVYGNKLMSMLNEVDVIGFRNQVSQKNYLLHYGKPKSSFIAYSGVSSFFLEKGKCNCPSFEDGVKDYVFVGSLIARKCPVEVVRALDSTYIDMPFSLTYIGDGEERKYVEKYKRKNCKGKILFPGRIDRNQIIGFLDKSQVFVMISKDEVFGLVYLEAMAFGLITIGSRNEGIDGIIKDGENGFLCEAGNEKELRMIIMKIRNMSRVELELMSAKAKQTAHEYSDSNVARRYINSIQ